jgi:hypothetical protein
MRDHVVAFMAEHVLGTFTSRPTGGDLSRTEVSEQGIASTPPGILGSVFPVVGGLMDPVTVRINDEEPIQLQDKYQYSFEELSPGAHVLQATSAPRFDAVFRMPTFERSSFTSLPLFLPTTLKELASSVGETVEEALGIVLVSVENYHDGKWVGPVTGATITLDAGQIYYGPYAQLDDTFAETGEGASLAFNLEPGTHSLSVDYALARCHHFYDYSPDADAEEVLFEVRAGAVAFVDIACE